jgi:hypothetical protein
LDPKSEDKRSIEAKLARCRELAKEFTLGPTADMLRDLKDELGEQMRALEKD